MSRNSVSEPPIVVPWPHIVSRTGVTVEVAARAFVRAFARREMAEGKLVWFALPGLVWFSNEDVVEIPLCLLEVV